MSETEKIVTITKFIGSESGGTTGTFTTSSNTQTAFDSFSATIFRSALYTIQLTSNTSYQTFELSVLQDGANTYLSQYGEISNNGPLATIDAVVAYNFVEMLITPVNPTTEVQFSKILLPL
jgi:hypothetical protein